MTDFHHSLDRALDDEHPYAWAPPADTSFVDNFPRTESADHQQWLDDSLWDMALEEAVAYDGFGAPLFSHQVLTIQFGPIGLEAMELLVGQGLIPLCDRELPAEGTE